MSSLKKISVSKQTLGYAAVLLYSICVYGPMAVMSIGAGIVFAVWIGTNAKNLGTAFRQIGRSPLLPPTLALVAACLWSLLWAQLSGLTFYGMHPDISWREDTHKLWHVFFPFVLLGVLGTLDDRQLKNSAKLWLGFGLLSAVLGCVQYYLPIYHPSGLPQVYDRQNDGFLSHLVGKYHATGMAGFHLSYASIMTFPALVWTVFALRSLRNFKLGSRQSWVAVLGFVIFFFANLFTYSKIAWLAFPLTTLFATALLLKGRPRWIFAGTILAFAVIWGFSTEFRLRMMETGTITERMEVWRANADMVRQHPISGVGWQKNSQLSHAYYVAHGIPDEPSHKIWKLPVFESHAHNNFLDQWATTGLLGLAAFLWWNTLILILTAEIYRKGKDPFWKIFATGLCCGWFCLHINGLTQANWWDAKVLHQIAWVTAMTLEVRTRKGRSGSEEIF